MNVKREQDAEGWARQSKRGTCMVSQRVSEQTEDSKTNITV